MSVDAQPALHVIWGRLRLDGLQDVGAQENGRRMCKVDTVDYVERLMDAWREGVHGDCWVG